MDNETRAFLGDSALWQGAQLILDDVNGLWGGQRVTVRGDGNAYITLVDVSLAEQPGTSSIQNQLRGVVEAVGDDEHPALALVQVRVGAALLLARLTRRSAEQLGVAPGQRLWVQVKSVALLETR